MPIKMDKPQKNGGLIPIIETVFMWALSSFMFVFGIVLLPSFSSICLLLFTLISVPSKDIQDFWESKQIKGVLKAMILVILFALSLILYHE